MAVTPRAVAALAVWAAVAPAQQPTFRSATRIVEVSVNAARPDGSAVTDLSVAELKLTDNGRPQEIRSLERVQGVGTASQRPTPRRLTILLLDALNTDWSDQVYARQAASQALEQVEPGERVAVFALGRDLRLLHDFSSDYASLRALIQRFRGEVPPPGANTVANPFSAEFSYSDLVARPGPRDGAWAATRQRQNILDTFSALKAIARLVRPAPGQKNLLWLSASFPLRIRSAGGGPTSFDSFHTDAEAAMRELNAANVTLYPIDARGLSVSPLAHINIGTMQEVAELTGGQAYYNGNDLGRMVRSAIEDSRDAYVLTYAPSEYAEDGRYHRVRLTTARRGVRIRHRPGYYADKPATPAR